MFFNILSAKKQKTKNKQTLKSKQKAPQIQKTTPNEKNRIKTPVKGNNFSCFH